MSQVGVNTDLAGARAARILGIRRVFPTQPVRPGNSDPVWHEQGARGHGRCQVEATTRTIKVKGGLPNNDSAASERPTAATTV